MHPIKFANSLMTLNEMSGVRAMIVIAAGGHSWYYNFGIDDYLLAFALPVAARPATESALRQ